MPIQPRREAQEAVAGLQAQQVVLQAARGRAVSSSAAAAEAQQIASPSTGCKQQGMSSGDAVQQAAVLLPWPGRVCHSLS